MNNIMPMSTTGRHNKITSSLFGNIFNLVKNDEVYALQEQCALVHWGNRNKNDLTYLVDAEDIENMEEFKDLVIYELDYVQPDFFLFKDNKYITDSRDLRTAGQPDLIVEVWSKSNTRNDRAFLQNLYAASEKTEFWQVEQNSNKVNCSIGAVKLPEQSLTNILKTQKGLEFDLRYLAIKN